MRKFLKKAASAACAASMLLGMFAGATPKAKAAGATLGYWPEALDISNEYYYQNTTLQPYGACFQIDELKNWTPDHDPDAKYNRGSIPLADRWMGPTVNPGASRDAKVMPLAVANARASQAQSQGGNGASAYVFNNFQYIDTWDFWGGSSAEGPIAIPSPELIDSAHRNGVPVVGTIFIPWGDETYGSQFVREMTVKAEDGTFPAADKLIEIAQYYGFDGYMINAESGTSVGNLKEFLAYIQTVKPDHFTMTWYNGSGSLSSGAINAWMQNGDTRINDGWWLDMGGRGDVDSTIDSAYQTGVDPWNIYSSWEYWPMTSDARGGDYHARLGEDGILKCSLGILAPHCTLTQAKDPDDFINNQDQKMWVGPTYDPTSTYRPTNEFCGFANLVADKTPVIGTDFVTNFTAGNGYKFYENGQVVGKENGWYNRSLTDVLPTWRWIIESEGQKLSGKIDYEDAWYAGSSMKIFGSMDAGKANHVKLYSAQLAITENTKFDFTYKTPVTGVNVELGLCFGDTYDAENFKFYSVTTNANGEWNTSTVDLAGDAGKTAIAISLRFTAPDGVSDYAINVGTMAFTTNKTVPEATSSVTLDEAIYPTDKTMEARIYWEKVENAFMYRIYRVHTDGTREFVGATPNNAFYLGSYTKEADETACTFEVVSYSENYVKGGVASIAIAWPTEVENGFVPVFDEGPNLALKQPALSSVACTGDGPVHQINDGTVLNASKWCSTANQGYAVIDLGENKTIQRWVVYHANCPGAGESVDMNTVAFDMQYAADDGGAILDPNDFASVERVKSLNYTVADEVRNNKQDITDRNLAEPITARYVKLNITTNSASAWGAIRIYEFELYEKAAICNTASPYARNVTVSNQIGAADTVVFDNVRMPYSTGTYASGGSIHEDTGKVRLFTSLDAEEPFAIAKATQPNEAYKQLGIGIASFENLELNANGGRLYYDVLDASSGEAKASRRASISYAPESGEAITAPTSATLSRTTFGNQTRKQYATLTLTGLEEGVTASIFTSADAKTPVLHTMASKNGAITQSRVPLNKEGGTVYYQLHKEGKPDSARIAVTYGDPMTLAADVTGLNELIAKCEKIAQSECTSATWTAFAEKLAAAKTVAAAAPTGAQAETARAELAAARISLRFKGNTQRLEELCSITTEELDELYTAASTNTLKTAIANAKSAIEKNDSDNAEIQQLRIAIYAGMRNLDPIIGADIFPDPVLRQAVKEQVGEGKSMLHKYSGTLNCAGLDIKDLTGLNLVTNLHGIDLSGTQITELQPGMLGLYVNAINLSGCKQLTTVKLSNVVETLNVSGCTALETLEITNRYCRVLNASGCTALKSLSVASYLGKEINLAGCSSLETLNLAGSKLTSLDITDCVKLHNFDVSNSNLDTIIAADASAYTNAYHWNWQNNKLDLTEGANAGKLFTGMKAYFETAELEPEISDEESTLVSGGSWSASTGATKVLDIGSVSKLSSLTFTNNYVDWYGNGYSIGKVNIEISNDGETYTQLMEWLDPNEGNHSNNTITLPDGSEARYVRITGTGVSSYFYTSSWTLKGYAVAPMGFLYNGQQPAFTRDVKPIYAKDNGAVYQLRDLAENALASTKLVQSGTLLSTLADADWLAADYVANNTVLPENVQIRVTDAAGNTQTFQADGTFTSTTAGTYTVSYANGYNTLLTGEIHVDHDFVNGAYTAPSCSAEGSQVRGCVNCGHEETVSVPKTEHTWDEGVITAPTCTEEGYTIFTCTECGETMKGNIVKALGHNHEAVVTAPSCETVGYTTYTCTECGDSYVSDIVAALGHSYKDVVTAPTCDAMGYTTHTCERCGDSYIDTFVPATDHDYEQTVTKEATCTEEGELTFTCKHDGCGKTYTQVLPKADHDCKATVVEATCLGYGYTQYKCENCDHSYIDALTQPLGHSYKDVVTAPTCDEGGFTTHTCERCGDSYVDSYTEALGHKCAAFTDIANHWGKDAICFVTERNLFAGTTATTFGPNVNMTRGMLVTVLYRLEGTPDVEEASPFTDVKADEYFADPIAWAAANGIVAGKDETTFAPYENVTREQMAAILMRYAAYKKYDVTATNDLTAFVDASSISEYALPAMQWAVGAGIISGRSTTVLAPSGHATRAEVASLLARFVELIEK